MLLIKLFCTSCHLFDVPLFFFILRFSFCFFDIYHDNDNNGHGRIVHFKKQPDAAILYPNISCNSCIISRLFRWSGRANNFQLLFYFSHHQYHHRHDARLFCFVCLSYNNKINLTNELEYMVRDDDSSRVYLHYILSFVLFFCDVNTLIMTLVQDRNVFHAQLAHNNFACLFLYCLTRS